jgi:PAS domain S-box-containing protein
MAAIYLVGGIENTWGFVPALIIILAGVYFSFSTGIFLALMSIFLFAAMAFGEIYGFIPHFSAYGFSEEIWKNTNYVLDYVTGMAVLYFSSAFVSGYFGQRIRESNILLEKEVSTLRARLEKKLEETNAELYQRSKELESILAERRQMEGALRESEGRLRTILDTIQLGIVIIDAKTHLIIDANPVAVEMIGTPKEKITGHICHKFICPAEVGKCPITDLGQIVDRSERKLVKANGETVPILKTVTRMILGGSEHLVESFIDITERKRAEEELKKRAEELEKMNKFMVGRELDMIELKKEVNQLLKELGRTEKYTT